MADPFAALELSMAANALGAFANVTVTFGAASGPGVFDDESRDALGIASTEPHVVVLSSLVAAASHGSAITVGTTAYTVAALDTAGPGLTRVRLTET